MNSNNKEPIKIVLGARNFLAKKFKCSPTTVHKALRYANDTLLQRQIRNEAKKYEVSQT